MPQGGLGGVSRWLLSMWNLRPWGVQKGQGRGGAPHPLQPPRPPHGAACATSGTRVGGSGTRRAGTWGQTWCQGSPVPPPSLHGRLQCPHLLHRGLCVPMSPESPLTPQGSLCSHVPTHSTGVSVSPCPHSLHGSLSAVCPSMNIQVAFALKRFPTGVAGELTCAWGHGDVGRCCGTLGDVGGCRGTLGDTGHSPESTSICRRSWKLLPEPWGQSREQLWGHSWGHPHVRLSRSTKREGQWGGSWGDTGAHGGGRGGTQGVSGGSVPGSCCGAVPVFWGKRHQWAPGAPRQGGERGGSAGCAACRGMGGV